MEHEDDGNCILHAVSVPGDGNCLFHSVALILLDWLGRKGRAEPVALPAEPAAKEVRDVAMYLRGLVASRVLDCNDEESEKIVATWRSLAAEGRRDAEGGAGFLTELQHVDASLPETGPLPLADRRRLFRNMLNPARYWGDEFALRTLEASLNCLLCVVNENLVVIKREANRNGRVSRLSRLPAGILPDSSTFLGVLLLRHSHYEPAAAEDGQKAWDMAALPTNLQQVANYWLGEAGGEDASQSRA